VCIFFVRSKDTDVAIGTVNDVYNYNILHSTGLFFTSPVTDEYRLKWFRKLKTKTYNGESYPYLLGMRKEVDGREVKLGYVCYLPWLEGEDFQR
jgi:L-amino acid N-acyltransferase YncA